jgi:hypothetical protein
MELWSRQSLNYPKISQNFMKPEGSLPYSQEPSTDPYPDPEEYNPHRSFIFL